MFIHYLKCSNSPVSRIYSDVYLSSVSQNMILEEKKRKEEMVAGTRNFD